MKKIIATLTAIIMLLAFTACGSSDPAGDFVNIISGGKFSFDIEMEVDGEKITGYIAMDGERMATKVDGNDESIRAIAKDNTVYIIFDEMEAYLEIPAEDDIGADDMFMGLNSGIKPTKSGEGTATINGDSVDYSDYEIDGGGYFRVFVKDGSVIAFTTSDMHGENVFVSNVKSSASSDLFELPAGYKAYSDMWEMMMDMIDLYDF
jgi:hypothetical protein